MTPPLACLLVGLSVLGVVSALIAGYVLGSRRYLGEVCRLERRLWVRHLDLEDAEQELLRLETTNAVLTATLREKWAREGKMEPSRN